MKLITDFEVKGKRVLVRCDFNVSFDEKGISDDFRIKKTIPTINHLLKNEAKVILMSHLGRPEGKFRAELSLSLVQDKLLEYLDCSITKADDCFGQTVENWTNQMQEGEILLLENLRFYKEEEENDLEFAESLSRLGDIFINEAFAVSHRDHASLVGVPKFLPSGLGFLFKQEIEGLSRILKEPKKPVIGIIGGSKPSKIESVGHLLNKVDFLLVGGRISSLILGAKGLLKQKPLLDPEIAQDIKRIELKDSRIKLPEDFMVLAGKKGDGLKVRDLEKVGEKEQVLDIGPETRKAFVEIIKKAKTVFWAGPLGKIENSSFRQGSLEVAEAINNLKAFSVVGGRETINFLRENNLIKGFSHVSTGGGAMLEFLSLGSLPAIEALKQ